MIGGRCIGLTTSGAYGHRVRKSLLFACVEPEFATSGSQFDVYVQGEMRRATVLEHPAYDPENLRMKV